MSTATFVNDFWLCHPHISHRWKGDIIDQVTHSNDEAKLIKRSSVRGQVLCLGCTMNEEKKTNMSSNIVYFYVPAWDKRK